MMAAAYGCLMMNRGYITNIRFAVPLLVLLLALEMPGPSSAWQSDSRSHQHNLPSDTFELAVDMMHYDHVYTYYSQPQPTVAERLKMAVERSRKRADFIHARTSGRSLQSTEAQKTVVLSTPDYYSAPEYLVKISLGTPPRTIVGIADTGSDLVWLQCKPSVLNFTQPDPIFDPAESSSYKPVPCTSGGVWTNQRCSACSANGTCLFEIAYGDNSSTMGDLATETLTLPSLTGSPVNFSDFDIGCAHIASGLSDGDGIVGLSQGQNSLVSQLGPHIGYVFSYCLVDFTTSLNKTSNLLLGSTGNVPLTYTPLVYNKATPDDSTFYYVNLTAISVNGEKIDYPADTFAIDESGQGGMIVDSGTAVSRLDNRAFTPLVNRLSSIIPYPAYPNASTVLGYDLCYNLSSVTPNPSFPSVSFQFEGGLNVTLPSENLFFDLGDGTDVVVCLLVEGTAEGDTSIFGNIQQQNFRVAFDLAKQRVGFAPETC